MIEFILPGLLVSASFASLGAAIRFFWIGERVAMAFAGLFLLDGISLFATGLSGTGAIPSAWTDPLRLALLFTPFAAGLAWYATRPAIMSRPRRWISLGVLALGALVTMGALEETLRVGCPWTCTRPNATSFGGAYVAQWALAPTFLFVGWLLLRQPEERTRRVGALLLARAALEAGLVAGKLFATGTLNPYPVLLPVPLLVLGSGVLVLAGGAIALVLLGGRVGYGLAGLALGVMGSGFAQPVWGLLGPWAYASWLLLTPALVMLWWEAQEDVIPKARRLELSVALRVAPPQGQPEAGAPLPDEASPAVQR